MSEEFAEAYTPPEVMQDTSIDVFIADFENIKPGERFRIPAIPDIQHAQQLATLSSEITILELPNGEIMIVKGLNRAKTGLTRGELLQLKPKTKIHTHPLQDINPDGLRRLLEKAELDPETIDSKAFGRMARIMPGPEDFTLGAVNAARDEIWTEMGKTEYKTYSAIDSASVSMALMIGGGLYSSKDYIRILADNDMPLEEKIDKLNQKLQVLGVSFDFTPWEELEDT